MAPTSAEYLFKEWIQWGVAVPDEAIIEIGFIVLVKLF